MSNIQSTDSLQIQDEIPEQKLSELAELFKVLGDPTRVRILWTLFNKELCVYEIATLLDMSQSAISHQLKTLKQAKLVKYRREGKTRYYSLDDDHVYTIFNQGYNHISE